MTWNLPNHPIRITLGLIFGALAGMTGFPMNAVFAAAGLQILWEL